MKTLIVLISLFCFIKNADATTFKDSKDFIESCKKSKNETVTKILRQIKCYVYVSGVVDTYVLINQLTTLPDTLRFCPPKTGMLLENVIDLIIHNVKARPSLSKMRPHDIILFTLMNRYTCAI